MNHARGKRHRHLYMPITLRVCMGKTTTLNTAARVMARFGASFDNPNSYTASYFDIATARPENFLPKATVRTVVDAEDPIDAFADIARTARDNAQAFLVKKDIAHFAPGAFENPEKAAAGAVVRFAHRYIQGIESEFTAYEYLQANGIQLLTTEEIGERLGITGTTEEIATKVERMDIDFMDTDGRTYQVKTGDNPNDYTVDTDYLVMVDGDTVKRYRQ